MPQQSQADPEWTTEDWNYTKHLSEYGVNCQGRITTNEMMAKAHFVCDSLEENITEQGAWPLKVINSTTGEAYADPRFARSGEVHDVEKRLADCGVEFELTQPVGVDTAEELLKAMDGHDAELLVIGIRHRTPVGKLLLGSVSQQLLLECPKPVLAVKPDEH